LATTNSLAKFKTDKDQLQPLSCCDVVEINRDCELCKLGQIKKLLKTRIKKHCNDIKKSDILSVISNYRLEYNHDFDWEGILEILDKGS